MYNGRGYEFSATDGDVLCIDYRIQSRQGSSNKKYQNTAFERSACFTKILHLIIPVVTNATGDVYDLGNTLREIRAVTSGPSVLVVKESQQN